MFQIKLSARALYPELASRYGRERDITRIVTLYRQPSWRHVLATMYDAYTEMIRPFAVRVEKRLQAGHDFACQDDCGEVITPDGEDDRSCVYIPWTSRQDLRCFDLAHARRRDVVELVISEEQFAVLRERLR